MDKQAVLEQQALEQLRRGDLRAAHQTLSTLLRYRPNDSQLRNRILQVEHLVRQREEAQARIQAEPLRYAHAYIQAGRLVEGLKLLRAALAKDPSNQRLRDLALEVAARLRRQAETGQRPANVDGPLPVPSVVPTPSPMSGLRVGQSTSGPSVSVPASGPSLAPVPAPSAPSLVPSLPPAQSSDLGRGTSAPSPRSGIFAAPRTNPLSLVPSSSASLPPSHDADSDAVREEAVRRARREAELRARSRTGGQVDPARQEAIARARAQAEARARGATNDVVAPAPPVGPNGAEPPARSFPPPTAQWMFDISDGDDMEQTEVGPPPGSPDVAADRAPDAGGVNLRIENRVLPPPPPPPDEEDDGAFAASDATESWALESSTAELPSALERMPSMPVSEPSADLSNTMGSLAEGLTVDPPAAFVEPPAFGPPRAEGLVALAGSTTALAVEEENADSRVALLRTLLYRIRSRVGRREE